MQISSTIGHRSTHSGLPQNKLEKYRSVRKAARGTEKTVGHDTYSPGKALTALKANGLLESLQDSEGETLLDNLHDLVQNAPATKRKERRDLLRWSLVHLANPEKTFHQLEAKTTCVPTTLAYDLMNENPAEFVRLVDGLSTSQGQVRLANGEVMSDPGHHDIKPMSGGSPVERLMQASLMDFGKPELPYNLNKDTFGNEPSIGLIAEEVNRVVEAVTGLEHDWVIPTQSEFEESLNFVDSTIPTVLIWDDAETAAEKSENEEVIHSHHMVLTTGVDEEFVYIRNPWGSRLADDQHLDVGRELLGDGRERFPKDKFFELMTYAVLPTKDEAAKIRAERGLPSIDQQKATEKPSPSVQPAPTPPKSRKSIGEILKNWLGFGSRP